ncbi:uncharacterized protein EAE97_011697 [Botrytis byssoidea]|uniref:Heterokaryon incompatibility domain-containing protein n=1 Tax=Botrytis byssoidea TaxID=139641 RepID=A0A9P5HXS4_9HELO|nr:uncharacterized protein EAE97_011697 [Botrytis byssoidea]KAF7919365.1 hypothetical protein EAE97_011697 [Botrytis byssoidea]
MEDIQQYQYTALLEPDAFRIIVIHHALSIESPLSCSLTYSTLFHYDQSLIDHYIALSYVWGDANNRKIILVDQKPLLINESLDSALRHLRDKKEDISVWADGICINQFDFKEKNKQVSLMSLIYEVARHTVIFLGETTSETDEIFELLDSPMSPMMKRTKPTLDLHSEEYTKSKIDDLIRQVIDMPWFRRIWILQELILSGDPWVQHDSALVKSPNHNVLNDMRMLRENFISGTPYSFGPCDYLLNILHSRRGYGVFNPRDMLYGHLALFANQSKSDDPEIEKLVEIDYRKSITDVYTDLALYILNRQCNFEFLSHLEDVNFEERKYNLPTWVPDWTSKGISSKMKGSWGTVLGCIGTRVGGVERIKNDIPKRKDVFALCHEIKNLRGGESSPFQLFLTERKILKLVCGYFCAWFNTPETSPYNFIPEDLARLLVDVYSRSTKTFFQRMELVSRIADPADLEPLRNYSEVFDAQRHQKDLWMHILMAMTDTSGNIFKGKKLAGLGNGRIALVSVRAEVGDEIWRFNGDEEGPYFVLRLFDGDEVVGLIEKKEKDGEKDGIAEMDRRFEAFFREKKTQSMERYVECRNDGRIVWNKRMLETEANMRFMREISHKTMRNSLMRAARVLAKLESEVNDDGKRKREKELKENLKKKMEMVVGNVLQEIHDKPRDPSHANRAGKIKMELKRNFKRRREMVVGNVLQEMHDKPRHLFRAGIHHDQLHEITDADVMLLRTDVDGTRMERGW